MKLSTGHYYYKIYRELFVIIIMITLLSTACEKNNKPSLDISSTTQNNVHQSIGQIKLKSGTNSYVLEDNDFPIKNQKWNYENYDIYFSNPAVGPDGTIYVGGGDHNLYAFDPSGNKKWTYKADDMINDKPVISNDGSIYAGVETKNLISLDPNGNLKWKLPLKWGNNTPVLASDGTIYVSYNEDPNNKPMIYALSPDGKQKWVTTLDCLGYFSTPSIGPDGTLYVGNNSGNEENLSGCICSFHALNPSDGKEKWEFQPTKRGFFVPPAFGLDGTIFIASGTKTLYALNPADGKMKWSLDLTGNVRNPPSVGIDGTVYIGCKDDITRSVKLYALNPVDGTEKWSFTKDSNSSIACFVGPTGTIYVSAVGLYAFNPDGSKKWLFKEDRSGIPSIASDGTIYVGTLYHLYALYPDLSVTYNGNANTGGSVPVDMTNYVPNMNVTILGNTGNLVKTGFIFDGWNTKSDGTGVTYQQGAVFNIGSSSVTLFAKWTKVYAVGDIGPAGGYVFYDKGSYSDGWRYLEAAPSDQSSGIQWYNGSYILVGTKETKSIVGTGKSNTTVIVAAQGVGRYAAKLCDDLSITNNGITYKDWFLPSYFELCEIFNNLKAKGLGGFVDNGIYWSSSEIDASSAAMNPTKGGYLAGMKSYPARVRACRAF